MAVVKLNIDLIRLKLGEIYLRCDLEVLAHPKGTPIFSHWRLDLDIFPQRTQPFDLTGQIPCFFRLIGKQGIIAFGSREIV